LAPYTILPDRPSYSAFGPRRPRRHVWSVALIVVAALGSLAWDGENTPRRRVEPAGIGVEAGTAVPPEQGAASLHGLKDDAPAETPVCVAQDTPPVDEPTLSLCSAASETHLAHSISGSGESAAPAASCPDGMVEIQGEYCPSLAQFCTRFVDPTR
jgi:hypothetical protein